MTSCHSDSLVIDFKSMNEKAYWSISKNDFGILVVVLDMFMVLSFIVFVNRIED